MSSQRKGSILPEYRTNGIKLLSTYIKPISRAKIVEKSINDAIPDEQEYLQRIYDYIGKLSINPNEKFSIDVWDSSCFKEYENIESHEINLLTNDIQLEKGEFPCKYCKSQECFTFQLQTRSIDEGATTFCLCTKCKRRFRVN